MLSALRHDDFDVAKLIHCLTYADGKPRFWEGSPTRQRPHAGFEVVCWDSRVTMLIGGSDPIEQAFCRAYPVLAI